MGDYYDFDDDFIDDPLRPYHHAYGHFPATRRELKDLRDRHEELEVEVGRLSGVLFKFAKMFAEEINI